MSTSRPLYLALLVLFMGSGILVYAGTLEIERVEQELTAHVGQTIAGCVIIDPGHGGIDGGCHRGGVFEKDIVLDIALRTRDTLRAWGVDVCMTREIDCALDHLIEKVKLPVRHKRDLLARIVYAKESAADILISIHGNSAPDTNTQGAMFFFGPQSEEGSALAFHLHREIGLLQQGKQFIPSVADYYITNRKNPVSVLLEVGFLSNDQERTLLSDPEYREKMAIAIARGIRRFLENYRGLDF